MSEPREPLNTQPGGIQFDRAEYAGEESPGSFCRMCRRPLQDEYYDVGGNVVCPACLANWSRPRSRLARGLKALLFGSVAAAVGAGIYRMITFGTGWNFSIVAILVGYMVGSAVRTGSGERGGRLYQCLAVFLTYSAIVGMFLPDLWQGMARGAREGREAGKRVEKNHRAEGKAADPKADPKRAGDPAAPAAKARPDAAKAATKSAEADVVDPPARPRRRPSMLYFLYLLVMLFLTSLLLVGLIYATPIWIGLNSPISLLIFGCALWQAWITTRASEMPVTGPYRVRG